MIIFILKRYFSYVERLQIKRIIVDAVVDEQNSLAVILVFTKFIYNLYKKIMFNFIMVNLVKLIELLNVVC